MSVVKTVKMSLQRIGCKTIGAMLPSELYNWSATAGHPDNLFIPATSSLIVPSVTINIHEEETDFAVNI